jgi:pimeloyl-ACP methyl ester carboxylesterase
MFCSGQPEIINMKVLILLTALVLAGCSNDFSNVKNESSQGFVSVGNSKLYYEVAGAGEPVLFAHAGFMDHKMWDSQLKDFINSGYKIIRVDLPGHGLSSDADTSIFIPDYINALLNHLKIDKVSLVGLSLGGATVTDFALEHSSMVNKLVLVSSVATGFQPAKPDTMFAAYLPAITNAKSNEETAAVFTRYWGVGQRDPGEMDKKVYNYVYETSLKSVTEHGWKKWARFKDMQGIKRLNELKMPVLIVYADKDLEIINEATALMDSTISDSKAILMKGPAHMLNMESPTEFNRIVIDFLKR